MRFGGRTNLIHNRAGNQAMEQTLEREIIALMLLQPHAGRTATSLNGEEYTMKPLFMASIKFHYCVSIVVWFC